MHESQTITSPGTSQAVDGGAKAHSCLLCGSPANEPIFNEFGIDILRCRQCGHVFSSFVGDPHYDGFWGDKVPDEEHFYWGKARARMHKDFFSRFVVGRSGRLLDMGCGLGFFVKATEANPNWQAFGREISPAAVRYARETLRLANVTQGPLENTDLPEGSFDVITMWDVLDHILKPDPILTRAHQLLKPGGVFFLRIPNLNNQLLRARVKKMVIGMRPGRPYMMARDHMHHYTQASVRRLLERNGFSSVEFTHLEPIQSVANRENAVVNTARNLCCGAVRGLAALTNNRINLDNLFITARKS